MAEDHPPDLGGQLAQRVPPVRVARGRCLGLPGHRLDDAVEQRVLVPLHFHWTPAALVPAAALILTVTEFSLIIAGMTIRWKRVQLLIETAMIAVMIFSASAVRLLRVPGWMTSVGRYFPATNTIASLDGVMLGHHGVTAPWGTGGLVWVAVTAAAYLAAGLAVFRLLERITRARGTLGAC